MMCMFDVLFLKKKFSDYMCEMYYFMQLMELVDNCEVLEVIFKMINVELQLFYLFDYLYWDMDFLSMIYDFLFLDEKVKWSILGGNVQKLFNFDLVMFEWKLEVNVKG